MNSEVIIVVAEGCDQCLTLADEIDRLTDDLRVVRSMYDITAKEYEDSHARIAELEGAIRKYELSCSYKNRELLFKALAKREQGEYTITGTA